MRTFAVHGTFDDCQRMVKEAFLDPAFAETHQLSSANSINVGRLLPQMVYYAGPASSCGAQNGRRANFIIPTGNLGNSLACVWARQVGLPIGEIVLATNANQTVTEFLRSGEWQPRASVPTLASAMDVGNPSNMERLRALYPDFEELQSADRRIQRRRHRDPRDDPPRLARARPALVPAHRDRGESVSATARPRCARPLGDRGDRASGQVQRHRRAADRPRSAGAAEPGAAAVAAAAGNGTRADACRRYARRCRSTDDGASRHRFPPGRWPAAGAARAARALRLGVTCCFARTGVRRAIDAAIASVAYEMLKNVLMPNGNGGQIHVHYLLLTQRGLLVADLLDRPGAIFGGDQMIEWTAIGKKRRYTFANPQHALYDRMAAVKLLTGDVPVEGRAAVHPAQRVSRRASRATCCASTISPTTSRWSTRRAATSPPPSATSGPT